MGLTEILGCFVWSGSREGMCTLPTNCCTAPPAGLTAVDLDDVAAAHVLAMLKPEVGPAVCTAACIADNTPA